MSKWKCGICNSEFDNFQAQGFGGTIYCPLCYFKELYRRTKLERDRLNNIINELEKYCNEEIIDYDKAINSKILSEIDRDRYEAEKVCFLDILDKLKALKENK